MVASAQSDIKLDLIVEDPGKMFFSIIMVSGDRYDSQIENSLTFSIGCQGVGHVSLNMAKSENYKTKHIA